MNLKGINKMNRKIGSRDRNLNPFFCKNLETANPSFLPFQLFKIREIFSHILQRLFIFTRYLQLKRLEIGRRLWSIIFWNDVLVCFYRRALFNYYLVIMLIFHYLILFIDNSLIFFFIVFRRYASHLLLIQQELRQNLLQSFRQIIQWATSTFTNKDQTLLYSFFIENINIYQNVLVSLNSYVFVAFQIIIISHVNMKTIIILLLILSLAATHQPRCLLEEPLTDACINSIDLSEGKTDVQIYSYLCIIAYERSLFSKAQSFCKQATNVNLQSAYRYFQVLLVNGKLEQAFKIQYSIFFSNPFSHNKQLLKSLITIKKHLVDREAQLPGLQKANNFTFSIFHFYNNQTDQSLKYLKAHLEQNKQNKELIYEHFLMARILEQQYQYYDGMNYIAEIIKTNTKSHPYLHHLNGNFLMHHIQFQKAIAEFEQANIEFYKLYKSRGFSFSNYNIGLCYQKLGKVKDAIRYYQKSVVNLQSADALNALGHAYFNLFEETKAKSELQQAKRYYTKSLQADQQYTVAIFNLGMLELANNSVAQAVQYFQKCVSMQQTFRSCKYGLLKAYYKLKQLDKISALIESIDLNQQIIAELAAILYEAKDQKRALQIIGTKQDYKSAELFQWKGFNEFTLQKYEDAERSFSKAIFLGAKKGYIYFSLGMAQKQLKKYEQCSRSFDHAYRLEARKQTKKYLAQCQKLSQSDL